MPDPAAPARADGHPDGTADGRGRTVLVVAILASFVAFLDGTVVNVALPAIGRTSAAVSSCSSGSWTLTSSPWAR
ncbi:hypothetical protein CMMCAS02_08095 [Clavibacter michiganensis subsp. michiganensis]|nr:hypothetical protein CMMCAS02_08095 [Clavibacter michiganensis subsp. michiganensis]